MLLITCRAAVRSLVSRSSTWTMCRGSSTLSASVT